MMKIPLKRITVATLATALALAAGSTRLDAADRKAKPSAESDRSTDNGVVEAAPTLKSIESISPNRLRLAWEWNVGSRPHENWTVFVHFVDANGEVKFLGDHEPDPPTSSWEPGNVELAPSEAGFPAGLTGTFDILVGLYQKQGGRARIDGATKERRVTVGQLTLADGKVEFVPAN